MLVSEVLAKAADLIEPEGKWIKGEFACNDKGGALIDGTHPDAVCWCAMGAIEKASGDPGGFVGKAANFFSETIPNHIGIGEWNDASDRTQAEVVAKLREASALAKEQGK